MAPLQPAIPSFTVSPPTGITPPDTKKGSTTTVPTKVSTPTIATTTDEKPKPPAARRPRPDIESTAAYRFLLLFQRNAAPPLYPQTIARDADADGEVDTDSAITTTTSNATSPTLTNASNDFDDVGSKLSSVSAAGKGDVSSLPSLSTSSTTMETMGGTMTPEMKCSVSAGVMGKTGAFHGSSAA